MCFQSIAVPASGSDQRQAASGSAQEILGLLHVQPVTYSEVYRDWSGDRQKAMGVLQAGSEEDAVRLPRMLRRQALPLPVCMADFEPR